MQVSSIHGFGHIVSTRRYSRLFWILVVIFGFSVAIYLIYVSFNDWSESPVSTTLETLPISKIKFPKVIVCPPKNTRTNLNYDLILSENLTLDNEGKKDFAKFINESLLDIIYNSIYEELRTYGDIENYRDWYDGITQLELPLDETSTYLQTTTTKKITLTTYATSGTFVTPKFGEKFDPNEFSLLAKFKLVIKVPSSVFQSRFDENTDTENPVELILEIFYDAIEKHDQRNYETVEILSDSYETLQSSNERIVRKIALNKRSIYVEFTRSLTQEEVDNWNTRRMTGMTVSWRYSSSSVEPERYFLKKDFWNSANSYFRKIASLVHNQHQSKEQLWRAARLAKMNQDLGPCYGNLFTSTLDEKQQSKLLQETLKNLGLKNISVENTSQEISDETMELATKIYIYLANCPKDYWFYWDIWINFYTDIARNNNVRTFLLTLSRIVLSSGEKDLIGREKGRMEFELSMRLLRKVSDIFHLRGFFREFSPSDPGRAGK